MGSCLSLEGSRALLYASASLSSGGGVWKRRKLRRSSNSSTSISSVDSEMEILLHRIPGRMCLNRSSDLALLFTKQGRKGINQDAMVVWENFSSKEDAIFCGVFDGHSPFGHLVAKKAYTWDFDNETGKNI